MIQETELIKFQKNCLIKDMFMFLLIITESNMREYGLSLTCILPHKDRIYHKTIKYAQTNQVSKKNGDQS